MGYRALYQDIAAGERKTRVGTEIDAAMNTLEASYVVFVSLAGLGMGSLVLLMIGHMMNEHWLAPVRSEAEAAALTIPLLLLLGIPLAFGLDRLFPWASGEAAMPPTRAAFLSPSFFILRTICYLLISGGIAFWLIRASNFRRASGIGLALLAPIMSLATYDWVLSRDPKWWSSLFGFAFGLSQVLAALAGAILITLLKPEHTSPKRMVSLERALLTLSLLAIWTWFAQFLIVWLANLPHEAAWYLARSDRMSLILIGAATVTIVGAIVVLVPSGVSRTGMIAGSALILLQHVAHMLWILQPKRLVALTDFALALGAAALWGVAFTILMRARPSYEDEKAPNP
jgi:hypothetical protein